MYEERWINLAHDNVYQIAGLGREYVLVDDMLLAIRILKSLDNDFYQCQVIPKDEVEEFFEERQIILHSWEEYLMVMGKRLEDPIVRRKYETAKTKKMQEEIKEVRRVMTDDI